MPDDDNATISGDFTYSLYTLEQLKKLSVNVTKTLSPAEKYDIFIGRYDYPLVHEEWQRTNASDPTWEGICHGWSPAALFFKEPNPVTLTNADGVSVPFGSSDVKALLSFYCGQYDTNRMTKFIGTRCESDLDENPDDADGVPACKDMDAGGFHVIAANEIGMHKRGFVIDRQRDYQVWNQPLNSYTSKIGPKGAARAGAGLSATASVNVTTTITYTRETDAAWTAHAPDLVERKYEYVLDLDARGRVIGGDFTSWGRPDFSWSVSVSPFFGYFASLQQIYQASVATEGTPVPEIRFDQPVTPEDHLLAPTHKNVYKLQGLVGYNNYPNGAHRSWTVGVPNLEAAPGHQWVTDIRFIRFDTERYFDTLSVYEGANGMGALVSVLHGQRRDQAVRVKSPSALLVFNSDQQHTRDGFLAEFKVHQIRLE
jgi:hypothetical protein